LKATGLIGNFYFNLLDWSARNVIAVAVGSAVCITSNTSAGSALLCDVSKPSSASASASSVAAVAASSSSSSSSDHSTIVSSVAFSRTGEHVAIGSSDGCVRLWDVQHRAQVRCLPSFHAGHIGNLAWNGRGQLASNSRDGTTKIFDPRTRQGLIVTLRRHAGEVCGLKWSPDDAYLATGGSDCNVHIWSSRHFSDASASAQPVFSFEKHTAAVKAIAWAPTQTDVLATGGGASDGHIRYWSMLSGREFCAVQTGGQVTSLTWNRQRGGEVLSTQGFPHNILQVWRPMRGPASKPLLATLSGHTSRILYCAASPDGTRILTGSGGSDDQLCFWDVFPQVVAAPFQPHRIAMSTLLSMR